MLEEVDPTRAAGSQDRQTDTLVAFHELLDTAEKLGAFLHDGKVGSEVGVEHIVEAEATQGSGHLAGDDGAGGHAELFTEGHTRGRSRVDDDGLLRIVDGSHDVAGVVHLSEGADRANLDALTAHDARRVDEVLLEGRSHDGAEATVDGAQGTNGLDVVTHVLATAAHHALVHVAHDAGRHVLTIVALFTLERDVADAEVLGQALELAVAALGAGQAVGRVVAEDQFDHSTTGVDDAGAVGQHFHAFHAVGGASRGQVTTRTAVEVFHHFDDANAAATGFVFKFHSCQFKIAKGRNMDTSHAGGFQDSSAFRDLDLFVINCYINHNMSPPLFYLTEMALNLQPLIQAPHLMHLVESMTIEGSLWPGAM